MPLWPLNQRLRPKPFLDRPFGLRPFGPLASLRFSQVAQGDLPSPRLAIEQNDSPFFIPPFFHSLLTLLTHGPDPVTSEDGVRQGLWRER